MSGPVHVVLAYFFCGIGLSASGAWFLLRARASADSWPDIVDTPAGVRRRRQRRNLGMAVVGLLSVATAAGLVVIDPLQAPRMFGWYWMLVLLLVLWLCVLAATDVLHTIRVQRRWAETRVRAALEEYLRCLQKDEQPPEEE